MHTYGINQEQLDYLNSLTCQRLTANPMNRVLAQYIYNDINNDLAGNLRSAWSEDKRGGTAYYIVKDPNQNVLFYFSLRCGTLYQPGLYQKVKAAHNRAKTLYTAAAKGKGPKWALQEVESYKHNGEVPRYILDRLEDKYRKSKAYFDAVKKDLTHDPSQQLIQTEANYAGVEMVHFCANTLMRGAWERSCMGHHSVGQVVFWQFILPIIQEMNRLVGCEYVYLFAAELGKEDKLLHYYSEKLHFEIPVGIGTLKPGYDVECAFMCQKLSELTKYQSEFFKNCNRPQESE